MNEEFENERVNPFKKKQNRKAGKVSGGRSPGTGDLCGL